MAAGEAPSIGANAARSSLGVRTHLRRLYDKAGADGQAALVRIVADSLRGV